MRRVNICEERGSGIDRVIAAVEEGHLPAPDFYSGTGFTRAVLLGPRVFADMLPGERIRACYQHAQLLDGRGNVRQQTQRFGRALMSPPPTPLMFREC